ncbi:outer membrane receptor protein involved in Fe transport [Algoriphagus ratkowskyi]|uniref:Outer membrane receptor protein involved in Fe transport n=1 Tax=Algoriphagus ratkowskyi TaxID=57028 RepID=A0A2W7T9F4_9BACT|nr:TonB-dependent receptor [Algoriphagus ratkowskyi]PZX59802.1 outer membrane receptor protein involved in Fe transport [Algoriphagus ratkowskyi]TXD78488.1 TonB-dependent receptor [Algoriphagus ratkowskyi]
MNKISKVSILIFFLISSFDAYSQEIRLKGKVMDGRRQSPLEFANIALLSPTDSAVVTGGMSGLDGVFDFTTAYGEYILRVGFIGYVEFYESISLGENKNSVNLGTITLEEDAQNLDEVVVEGVTSMFESDIDKRTYNVENSIVAEGQTASQLLSTLPSIQVDDEGGITMRGSGNILIYINGRPSNLSGDDTESILSQFPANSIKSVELITNPSSRYDATGVGGIINIVLKKNEKTGFNGQVNASIGTREKYQAGVNLNYGIQKANFYASYNWQNRRQIEGGEGSRNNYLEGFSPKLEQIQDGYELEKTHLLRAGVDYNISDRSLLGVYFQGNFDDETEYSDITQLNISQGGSVDSSFIRANDEWSSAGNYEGGINYTLNIDSLGQKLFTSLSYSYDNREQEDVSNQEYFDADGNSDPNKRLIQTNKNPRTSNLYVAQLDYEKPFTNGAFIETGLKASIGNWLRSQEFAQGDQFTDFTPLEVDTLSNSYNFDEQVYAGYFTYKNTVGKFGYQLGLRGEYTQTLGETVKDNESIPNDYFNVFPSAFFSYTIAPENELTMNYTRRISRPSIRDLSPLYRVRDQYNFSIGNPYLKPEFTDSYEIGYMKGWEKYLLNATVYHRYSTDVETRITYLTDDNVAIQTRENADTRASTGFELINQIQVYNNLDLTLTGNFFYSKINAENIEEDFSNENVSWTLNLLANYLIPNWFSMQIQGNYRGPIVLPQGQIEPQYSVNVGLRKDILNGKATISANASDIFNTRNFRITTTNPRFDEQRVFQRETRVGTLAFTYRFGGFKERAGENNSRREGGDDGDDF